MTTPEPQPAPPPATPTPQPTAPPPVAQSQPQSQTPQTAPPDPPHGDGAACDPRLEQAVGDAYTLLDFTCRTGAPPPDAIGRVLIASHQKLDNGETFDTTAETAFWDAFAHITEAVKPVTVQSILFTNPAPQPHKSLIANFLRPASQAERTLRHYLAFALITLLALLTLQVEWAIGTFIYNDAFTVHTHLLDAQSAVITAQNMRDNVQGTPAAQDADVKLKEAQSQLQLDQSWADVSYVRLWWWNRGAAAYVPPYDLIISHGDQPGAATSKVEGESGVNLNIEGKQRLEYTRTELTLQVLSHYMLVTLFALMGALTQALRTISRQIQDVSLTTNDLYRTRSRVILGVISGTCLAWLYVISTSPDATADSRSPLAAISFLGAFAPWAVAFISGYSVEIFFALLERVINILTAKISSIDLPQPKQPENTHAESKPPTPPANTQAHLPAQAD